MSDSIGHHMRSIDDFITSTLMDIEMNGETGVDLNLAEVIGRILVQQQMLARAVLAIARHLDEGEGGSSLADETT